MTDLDTLLAGHVERGRAVTAPALDTLRCRAVRRRRVRGAAALGVAGIVVAVGTSVVASGLTVNEWESRTQIAAGGKLTPRDPVRPGLGVLAGSIVRVPLPTQRAVTLRFTADDGRQYDVRTVQGGTWELDLPPGSYRITALEGGGVCPDQVTVSADAWQSDGVAWPCEGGRGFRPPGAPPAPPPAPPPS